jgi:steroid delta-isomerase-like uncharacterized protein
LAAPPEGETVSKELIRRYYQNFNAGDFNGMVELLSKNVQHDLNEGDTQTGRTAFSEFMKIMDAHYSERAVELEIFSGENAGRFAAEFFIEGAYKKTQSGLPEAKNQPYRLRVGAFFEVKNGLITRVTNHYNLRQWIGMVSG